MLGAKLRVLRKGRGLTLVEVASQTGLSVSFLSDVERGRAQPSLDTLQKIADAYDVDLHRLLEGVEIDVQHANAKYPPGLREFLNEVDVEPDLIDLLLRAEKRADPDQRAETKEDWMRFYYTLKSMLGR